MEGHSYYLMATQQMTIQECWVLAAQVLCDDKDPKDYTEQDWEKVALEYKCDPETVVQQFYPWLKRVGPFMYTTDGHHLYDVTDLGLY